MSNTGSIDYDALAKKYGAISSSPAPQSSGIDYDALAKKNGATSSTTYHGVVPQAQLDQIQRLNANPTKFEQDRAAAVEDSQNTENPWAAAGHAIPGIASAAVDELGNMAKGAAKFVATGGPIGQSVEGIQKGVQDFKTYRETGKTPDQIERDRRAAAGYGPAYRAAAAVGDSVGVNTRGMEDAADVGDHKKVLGIAIGDAAPLATGEVVKKFGPAVDKFASSAVDKFKVARDAGVKEAAFPNPTAQMPEASGLPVKAISGAEDIYRAAAPTGKNAGFRENVLVAAPDLADVARKVDIAEKKGGIVNPDLRVRATVDALDSHLDEMYKTERAPQIQAHADVPVKVGSNADSVRGLEYLETTAGTADIRGLAEKALGKIAEDGKRLAPQPLTLAETDMLAQAANKYLKNFERAPSDVQMQMQQTSPRVGGLKALDSELGRSINDALTSNGETGIRDYERRFAAVSEVRNQLRDRMNAVELERQSLGKYVKVLTGGKEGIASASQAAVSSVNIGRRLQTAFQKLRESGITAKK